MAPSVSRCRSRVFVLGLVLLVGLSARGEQDRSGASGRKVAFVSAAPLAEELTLSAKLDPLLRRLVRDHVSRAPLAWAVGSEAQEPLIRTEPLAVGGLAAGVFVKTTDLATTKARIRTLGGYVRVEAGDILVAVVPVVSLEILANATEVSSIEASQYSKTQLDVSRAATKADLVQAGTGVTARTGAGVVVGIVDSGIDYTRPDFITAGGSTRIRSIWDISGVAAGGNARICAPADINAATCAERDLNGHGTHVTGISAGGGRTQAGFIGMAPGADIIAAKATRATDASGSFSNDDVVAAASYIFQQAQSAGKPAVVNMSLGGFGPPLDGTSSYEQALSNLTGPGKIIIAAAGNSGSSPVHLSYGVQGSSYTDALETPWISASDNSPGYAYLWYASGSISVGIAARTSSSQDTGVIISTPIGAGQSTAVLDLKDGAGMVLAHYQIDATTTSYSSNGAHFVYVMLQPVVSRYFSLYTFGTGTFDAWASNTTFGTRTDSYWMPGDWQRTIGSPGTATKVITVGAYSTKLQWTDVNGSSWSAASWCGSAFPNVLGDIACFSSRGPTRDGRLKPEISAPGHRIASDLSVDSIPNHDLSDQMQGGKLLMESGTSQATPHITGIVALMLQANPLLTYETAVQALQNTATKDSFTGTGTNNTWGAGKVNALEAVKAVGGASGVPVANFTFSPPSPSAGQTIQLTDTSTGGPTSWSWDFGDGFGSTTQNPTHAFATAGTFSVALTVSNGGGSTTATKTVTVAPTGASSCVDDATTMCLVGGRYRIRSHWKNQYAGGALSTLSKAKLTDVTGAFWIADASTYEYLIRFNTATDNGRAWIAIPTFTDVEFWIDVTDTRTGQSHEYHSMAGNRTLIYDPTTFVYP